MVTKFDGSFYVSDSICTHEEADLSLGLFYNGIVTCPLHRAKFEIVTGTVVQGPDGKDPGTINSLHTYAVRIEGADLMADI